MLFPLLSNADISPSQVLILYNQDWTDDHPLTKKGQDSKEIAEYYVKMHTNPDTGEKPYILGLSEKKEQLLNHPHLAEKSSDNKSGVILSHLTRMIASTHGLCDGRLVEFKLPKNDPQWDFDTLKMQLGEKNAKLIDRLTVIENGQSLFPDRVHLQPAGAFTVRLNGTGFISGTFTAFVSCSDKLGKTTQWETEYNDIRDVKISHTGPDNVRDDKNYIEYVEKPIKQFLEDPANTLADGRLLKDHILFFVISHGLPRTCISTYGIEKGITTAPNNYGTMIDLGQRLQLMYYDFDQVTGTMPRPYKFDTKSPFSAYLFRSPRAYPLYGPKANPFVHPDIYNNKVKDKDLSKTITFTAQNRQKNPAHYLYFSMRLDGKDPVQAKALIDRSIYAGKYASPAMGVAPDQTVKKGESTTGDLSKNPAGQKLWEAGYKRIFYNYSSKYRLELFRLPPVAPFYNTSPVYLPGGIAATVISSSGWNSKNADLYHYLDAGVSVTAGAAQVYKGAPHIHNKSWWDDSVFYPALQDRKTVGEALLMNQAHLEWITCFIGDPLLQLPGNRADTPIPLDPDKVEVSLISLPTGFNPNHTAVVADLKNNNKAPRIAQMKLCPLNATAKEEESYVCGTFSAQPWIVMANETLEKHRDWILNLMDPFGNTIEIKISFPPA